MGSAKIMVVEDNTMVAEDCRDCLESLTYNVTSVVASGEEAIEKSEAERPDAVLMDIHLRDEMDGIEAAEQIYSRFKIPVVFLSAYADRELLERAKQVGSFGYLLKPFDVRELNATLEMALYKAKAEKERIHMKSLLQETQKMEAIGTLAGGIAHDFNNLLSIILGNLSIAKQDLKQGIDVSEFLDKIEKASLQERDLTYQLITFSKGGEPVKREITVGEFLKDSVLLALSNTNIRCNFSIPEDLGPVEFDEAQMSQVFRNVVDNAVEAIEKTGTIEVRAENFTHKR